MGLFFFILKTHSLRSIWIPQGFSLVDVAVYPFGAVAPSCLLPPASYIPQPVPLTSSPSPWIHNPCARTVRQIRAKTPAPPHDRRRYSHRFRHTCGHFFCYPSDPLWRARTYNDSSPPAGSFPRGKVDRQGGDNGSASGSTPDQSDRSPDKASALRGERAPRGGEPPPATATFCQTPLHLQHDKVSLSLSTTSERMSLQPAHYALDHEPSLTCESCRFAPVHTHAHRPGWTFRPPSAVCPGPAADYQRTRCQSNPHAPPSPRDATELRPMAAEVPPSPSE